VNLRTLKYIHRSSSGFPPWPLEAKKSKRAVHGTLSPSRLLQLQTLNETLLFRISHLAPSSQALKLSSSQALHSLSHFSSTQQQPTATTKVHLLQCGSLYCLESLLQLSPNARSEHMSSPMGPPQPAGYSLRVQLFGSTAYDASDRPIRCFRVVAAPDFTVEEFCMEASRIHQLNYGLYVFLSPTLPSLFCALPSHANHHADP
jgi:hypothetical protein